MNEISWLERKKERGLTPQFQDGKNHARGTMIGSGVLACLPLLVAPVS